MRPVNKGISPDKPINKYQEAKPYLIKRIGCYCSYCEMRISHVPEVEHVFAKSKGGSETDWENLLLACKYCNSTKNAKSTENWLSPERDNTFLAFTYEKGKPDINSSLMSNREAYKKAKQMFDDLNLVGLSKLSERWKDRIVAYNKAKDTFEFFKKITSDKQKSDYFKTITNMATATGFFSVWMTVFKSEPDVLITLINRFTGTAKDCFNEQGKAVPRPGGII